MSDDPLFKAIVAGLLGGIWVELMIIMIVILEIKGKL